MSMQGYALCASSEAGPQTEPWISAHRPSLYLMSSPGEETESGRHDLLAGV